MGKVLRKRHLFTIAALGFAAWASTNVRASTLLNLNPVPGTPTSALTYNLSFTADSTDTLLSFSGYQVPGSEQAVNIEAVADGSTTNLLGLAFTFTPGTAVADGSYQFASDSGSGGEGTNNIQFSTNGATPDMFSQSFATTVGATYQVNFGLRNASSPFNAPSSFVVATSDVPEPSAAGLGLLGIMGLAPVTRRRRVQA